jgi:hypothetical protein
MSDEVTPVPLTPTELAEYQSLVENTRNDWDLAQEKSLAKSHRLLATIYVLQAECAARLSGIHLLNERIDDLEACATEREELIEELESRAGMDGAAIKALRALYSPTGVPVLGFAAKVRAILDGGKP